MGVPDINCDLRSRGVDVYFIALQDILVASDLSNRNYSLPGHQTLQPWYTPFLIYLSILS